MLIPGIRCENGRTAPVTDADWIRFTEEMIAVARKTYKAVAGTEPGSGVRGDGRPVGRVRRVSPGVSRRPADRGHARSQRSPQTRRLAACRGVDPRTVAFARGSGNRLTSHDRDRFPGDSLFDRLARVVCEAGCLPRKELYEAWEVARRVRRVFRGGRVTDLAGGHGLLGHAMLLLDDSSPTAVVVDPVMPKSARTLHDLLVQAWPRLDGRVEHLSVTVEEYSWAQGMWWSPVTRAARSPTWS